MIVAAKAGPTKTSPTVDSDDANPIVAVGNASIMKYRVTRLNSTSAEPAMAIDRFTATGAVSIGS